MENIVIKRKEFENIEPLGDKSFKGFFKGKVYFIKKFEPKSEEYYDYIYFANRIRSALVLSPKLFLTDKKQGYVVSEFIEGISVLEYLSENDPSDEDKIYPNIFSSAHMARANGMALDFRPDNWIITDHGLCYLRRYFTSYDKSKDFTQTSIRLWFVTKDLAKYANEHGYTFDHNRLKDEYLTNKHLVLMTCKYYQ